MPGADRRGTLKFEGPEDLHAIGHFLQRKGFGFKREVTTNKWYVEQGPVFDDAGGARQLIDGIVEAIQYSNGHPVGVVLDADYTGVNGGLQARWQALSSQLGKLKVTIPQTPETDGLTVSVKKYATTFGAWLLPDNQRDGSLEDFLRDLISESDSVISFAESATNDAKSKHQAPYREGEATRKKAILHAWLAWQEEPGQPYGRAITKKYFENQSTAADDFVSWFRRLYGVDPAVNA